MRKILITVFGLTVLAGITGCRHPKAAVSVPPPPPPPPVKQHVETPHEAMVDIPMIPLPEPPNVVLGGKVERSLPQHEKQPASTPKPAETAKDNATDALHSATAGEEPPTTTPIGQLSTAPNTQGLPSRKNIGDEIQRIQQQIKSIHHALSAKQQRTASQIQTFLAKATNALQAGDLDGAHTLTVKAEVLLNEIQ